MTSRYTAKLLDKQMQEIEEVSLGYGDLDGALKIMNTMYCLGAINAEWAEIHKNGEMVNVKNLPLYFNSTGDK